MKTIYIDGAEGTTGLRIHERLLKRKDIRLKTLPETERKNAERRREELNSCDIAFLCLPDDAARGAVSMVENPDVRIIDTSTAHRTAPGWTYGFPELAADSGAKIAGSKRVANPGCHALGFISLVYPLINAGILPADSRLVCHSVTGYSGGGKKMIAQYEADSRSELLNAPRQYALGQEHRHLREMRLISGLITPPVFCPVVADFYSGMVVTVPLFIQDLTPGATAADAREVYRKLYAGEIVKYLDDAGEDGYMSAIALAGKDSMQITACGNAERILLISRFDNLGKGASGSAIECMNLMLGKAPELSLDL